MCVLQLSEPKIALKICENWLWSQLWTYIVIKINV